MVMFVEFVLAAMLLLAIVQLVLFRGLDMAVSTAQPDASARADRRASAEVAPCS